MSETSTVRLLCIGDIFAKPGRRAVRELLPSLIDELGIELAIANGENAAGGLGITASTARELLALPLGLLTGGNHSWRHREMYAFMDREPRVLRPLNYPDGAPGNGYGICATPGGVKVGVISLMGQIFMDRVRNPFDEVLPAIDALKEQCRIVLVDFHAEATSEKRALGWYLDGQVSAVFGTHTHVQTADEEILPGGTGYISDIGMTGPHDSVIGMRKDKVIERFKTMLPVSFSCASGNVRLCGVLLEIDTASGQTVAIQRINRPLADD